MRDIQKKLFDLPPYSDYGCSESDCTIPAVIRHPATGKFYCADHAWLLMESHPAHMGDLTQIILVRAYLLGTHAVCKFCKQAAERVCHGCRSRICFDHFSLVPRAGAACPTCAEEMERRAEESSMV